MQNKVVTEGYQLTPQQANIWLLQQADGSHAYMAQSAVLIEGEIVVETLKAAISEVVNRHEILRTNFHLLPEMTLPLQVIGSDQVVEFREIDLNEEDPQEKHARFEELFRQETLHRFDLKREPIARLSLFRLSISEMVLVTSLPAVCGDSRSLKNLFHEIAGAYAARLRDEEFSVQPVQYVDFAEWQKEALEQEAVKDERWNGLNPHLSSASPLMLGLEREGHAVAGPTGFGWLPNCVSVRLDDETTAKIDRISSAHNVSTGVFLLACWQILVWRLTGRKDIKIDILCESRRIGGLREALGAFASFCPVQSHIEPDYQFIEMLEIVDQSIRSANKRLNHLLHQDGGIKENGRLAERVNAIGFEFEEWPIAVSAGSAKFTYWKQFVCLDRFKLKLGGYRKADGITTEIQYDPALFAEESIELIKERYLRLIESAVEDERALIGDYEGRRDGQAKAHSYQTEKAMRGVGKDGAPPLIRAPRGGRRLYRSRSRDCGF